MSGNQAQQTDPLSERRRQLTLRRASLGDRIVALMMAYTEMGRSRQEMQSEQDVMDRLMERTRACIDLQKEELNNACREAVFLDRIMAEYQPTVAEAVADWMDH